MDIKNQTRKVQVDMPNEEALNEFGEAWTVAPDEYAKQCDYAGCYPWLIDFIGTPPPLSQ